MTLRPKAVSPSRLAHFVEQEWPMAKVLRVSTSDLKQIVDLSDRIEELIRQSKMQEGLCSVFVTHTTAALTTGEIGEGTEDDLLQVVEQMIPRIQFRHAHDPSHA